MKNKKIALKFTVIFSALLLAGCSLSGHKEEAANGIIDRGDYYADRTIAAVGQDSRVKFLIMHYTAGNTGESLKTLTQDDVSAHYLVSPSPEKKNNKPVIAQLVAENKRAWHAGISNWRGRTNLNDSSVGIEIVNPGFTEKEEVRTWYPFAQAQIEAVTLLAKDIIARHGIKPEHVLGHSDIAPLRKQDPGKLFPWQQLAEQGIGAWPDAATVEKHLAGRAPEAETSVLALQQALKQYGYDNMPQTGILDKETRMIISAFQMHFRQADISGNADAQTEAIAKALLEKYITPV